MVNYFLQHGILAISHNALPCHKKIDVSEEDEPMGPKAAGVTLAIIAQFAGGWTDIDKDDDGRAISANIILGDDTTARINAVYGVSGASSPNFTSFINKSMAEARLNDYITKQSKMCDHRSFHMVVAGGVIREA